MNFIVAMNQIYLHDHKIRADFQKKNDCIYYDYALDDIFMTVNGELKKLVITKQLVNATFIVLDK